MTETKKYAVIFDTNAYRQFVTGKSTEETLVLTENLVELESKKDIKAFGSVIVGMEMLGNLSENEDGYNFKDCLNGVIAMGNHCYDETANSPRIVPQAYLHIAKSYFNQVPQEIEERTKNLGDVIFDFKLDHDKALVNHKKKTFPDIKNYIDNEETIFSTQIIDLIEGVKQEIINKYPKIARKQLRAKLLDYIENGPFEPLIALAIIYAVAATLQLQLPQNEGLNKAFSLNTKFPLSVGFFRWISYKIVDGNIDMQSKTSKQKRWNWHWDYHVSFTISNSTLDDREVILVTSDGDMTEMLKDFGYPNRVFTLAEYLDFLKN
ncbi:MAG: hypothetical protein WCJ03_09070 [Bacteroidales bacterium]